MNATVKRKFNALIQGIGTGNSASSNNTNDKRPSGLYPTDTNDNLNPAASTTSSSPTSARMVNESADFLNKKRRVGTAQPTIVGGAPGSQTTPSKGITTISNITLRKWTPTGNKGTGAGAEVNKDGQLPKYCPGDRDQLLRRLATFQELTDWTPKPDPVNEIEWAKRGWTCQGKERVKCTLCGKEIFVKINKKEVDGKEIAVLIASEIAQSVVDMYKDMIVTSHAEDCLWRRRGCDGMSFLTVRIAALETTAHNELTAFTDSLLRLPLPNPKLALESLRQRYDELLERKDFLPYEFNLRLPETLNLDVVLSYLPPTFFTEPPPRTSKAIATSTGDNPPAPPTKPNRSALALALLGWEGLSNARIGPVPNSASCHTCLRRLGLWMFKSKEIDPETNQILVPAPMDHLDPLREHRFFCPWKNAAAQRNSGARPNPEQDKPGWELLIQSLRNEAFIRQRTSVVHSRSKSSVASPSSTVQAGRKDLLASAMKTPERRPMTSDGKAAQAATPQHQPSLLGTPGVDERDDEDDDEETTKQKDKERGNRLRRVRSLFNTKGGNPFKRLGSSRPGTSHSTASKASKAGE